VDWELILLRMGQEDIRMLLFVRPSLQVDLITGNAKKNDVHIVNIESKYSRFFYANYLWDLL
jgi:Spc24 subunit of Ndc80